LGCSRIGLRSTGVAMSRASTFKSALKAVGQSVRAARLRAGLTQEKAAASAGIGYKRYQRIESGGANITLLTLHRLARALDTDLRGLLSDSDD
jgi:transcriptional regulator with XRE-family HTH domain